MGLDTEEESGAGARLLGVSLGALSTTAQLALLPGEAVPASAADPAGPADARGDRGLLANGAKTAANASANTH